MSEESKKEEDSGTKLPKYSWEEIARHNTPQSLWVVCQDKVYDVSKFMEEVCQLLYLAWNIIACR